MLLFMDYIIFDNLSILEKEDIIKYLQAKIESEINLKKFNSDKKAYEEFIKFNSKYNRGNL